MRLSRSDLRRAFVGGTFGLFAVGCGDGGADQNADANTPNVSANPQASAGSSATVVPPADSPAASSPAGGTAGEAPVPNASPPVPEPATSPPSTVPVGVPGTASAEGGSGGAEGGAAGEAAAGSGGNTAGSGGTSVGGNGEEPPGPGGALNEAGGSGGVGAAGAGANVGGAAGAGGCANLEGGCMGGIGGCPAGIGSCAAGAGGVGDGMDGCPKSGSVTYEFNDPGAWPADALEKLTGALDEAVWYYNCYSELSHSLTINYEPSVPTAEANVDGWISFGSDRNYMVVATVMHEIGHTMGVGFSPWSELIVDGRWSGESVAELMGSIPANERDAGYGERDYITCDSQHFWPYGLNYASEHESEWSLINHVRVVDAMNQDKAALRAR